MVYTKAPVRSVGHAVSWSVLNTAVTKVVGIVAAAITLRIVSPEDFGAFTAAAAIYAVIVGMADLGLSAMLARHDVSVKHIAPAVSGLALASGVLGAAAMYLGADVLADLMGTPTAAGAIRIMSLCVLMSGVMAVPTGLLYRDFNQRRLFLANAVAIIPANALLVVLALSGDGAEAFAWSRVLAQAIVAVAILGRGRMPVRPEFTPATIRAVLAFGLPLTGANLIGFALLNADYLVIGRTVGAASLGIYALAYNIASWPTSMLGAAINSVGIPVFSRYPAGSSELSGAVRRGIRMASLFAFPLGIAIAVLAGPLVEIIYGPTWAAAASTLTILCIYGMVFPIGVVLANVLAGIGRSSRLLAVQALWIAVLVPGMLIGAHLDGLDGVAIVHVVVLLVVVFPAYWIALRGQVPHLLRSVAAGCGRPLAGAVCGGAAAWLLQLPVADPWLKCLVVSVVGLSVYALFVLPELRAMRRAREV